MQTNRSYIFFAERPLGDPGLGSTGSLGTNLTPLASLAVDSRIHALGAPFYVAAEGPDPVHEMMVAQDIGGAIRGAARGDMFFGFGADAERRAGAMKASGKTVSVATQRAGRKDRRGTRLSMSRRTTSDDERKLFEQTFKEGRPIKAARP
jgi:membrane-bound lytic murein transglycosylase